MECLVKGVVVRFECDAASLLHTSQQPAVLRRAEYAAASAAAAEAEGRLRAELAAVGAAAAGASADVEQLRAQSEAAMALQARFLAGSYCCFGAAFCTYEGTTMQLPFLMGISLVFLSRDIYIYDICMYQQGSIILLLRRPQAATLARKVDGDRSADALRAKTDEMAATVRARAFDNVVRWLLFTCCCTHVNHSNGRLVFARHDRRLPFFHPAF